MAEIIGIAIAPKILAPMQECEAVGVTIDDGLDGDARGRKRGRQVTILFEEDWQDAVAETGAPLDWTERRANFHVRGMRSPREDGGIFNIGTAQLKVVMETDPCDLMESKRVGLRQAMMPDWRGGVCCEVIAGGDVSIGDAVTYQPKG